MYQTIINTIVLLALGAIFMHEFVQGVEKQMDQQSIMLCNAAKVSGNEEYTLRCANFYQTGDITTLR